MTIRRVCDKCNRIINDFNYVSVRISHDNDMSIIKDYHITCFEKLINKDVSSTFFNRKKNTNGTDNTI